MSKVEYPAFAGGEAERQAIIDRMEERLAPFGVRVVVEPPPPELPYRTIMFGGHPSLVGLGGGSLSVSCQHDCGDTWWRDSGLVFTDVALSTEMIANAGLSMFGRSAGLDYTQGIQSIMFPYIDSSIRHWGSECTPFHEDAACSHVHEELCPPGEQNDVMELLAIFGQNSPDVVAPTVEILEPADGAALAGPDIDVAVAVSDDHEGYGWRLTVTRDDVGIIDKPIFDGQKAWNFHNVGPGVYRITVTAIDHDRNTGVDEVTVQVGAPTPEPGDTDGATESATDGTGDVESEGSGAPSSSSGGDDGATTANELEDAEGCACAATTGSRPWMGLLGLPALLVRRRRRARA